MARVTLDLTDERRREAARWAADCARRVLFLFEAVAPDDERPRAAIAAVRAYVKRGKPVSTLRPHVRAALAAAREVGDLAAASAARAAACAAAAPFMHAQVTPDQSKHLLCAATYAAAAREQAPRGRPGDGDAELMWATAQAGPIVRALLAELPRRKKTGGAQAAWLYALDSYLRRPPQP